ncbi:hypothetical protein NQ314_000746 [Rhamnusium bicolor]|uniref:Transposase Helix-turn-helix domain-containing protein n=1 Tax=Rhamnusium bicolor TaxID=1586634 RepID=A0AAV8ZX84_9CUCU|nr:hypothetical protein NQ314_000746 [Rhamnusium bicolor]
MQELLIVLKPDNFECGRRPPYPLLDSLLLTIWSLATQESFREIGSRFNVSEGHAYRILLKCCTQITHLKDDYIVWPRGQQTERHLQEFNTLRGEHSFPSMS